MGLGGGLEGTELARIALICKKQPAGIVLVCVCLCEGVCVCVGVFV